jgi:hypothetical protein
MTVPTNDEIQNAIAIGNGSTAGTTINISAADQTDATLSAGEPDAAAGGNATNTVWYSYTPLTDGTVTITTDGSPNDTTLAAYQLTDTGQPLSYTNLTDDAGDDDDGSGPNGVSSTISFAVLAGQTYYIQQGVYQGDVNNTTMSVSGPAVACYASGTLIGTTKGEVRVEALNIGDLVITAAGEERPIRWIGHGVVDCHRHDDPRSVFPVKIAAGAFGEGRPAQDLLVSPNHAICLDLLGEALIPAIALVNGSTIRQIDVDTVTYWHVELDSHDLLLANGQPAESYMDLGNRAFFGVGQGPVDPTRTPASLEDCCRPFLTEAAALNVVRDRLKARAIALGWHLEEPTAAGFHIVADGEVIHPEVEKLSGRFLLPATVREAWLVSAVATPAGNGGSKDRRPLGVLVRKMTIDDGLSPKREIDVTDARLDTGFHQPEVYDWGSCRWTDGRARLPAALWEGCRGQFFLRVDLSRAGLPRWSEPRRDVLEQMETVALRLVGTAT